MRDVHAPSRGFSRFFFLLSRENISRRSMKYDPVKKKKTFLRFSGCVKMGDWVVSARSDDPFFHEKRMAFVRAIFQYVDMITIEAEALFV